ncbi:fimbrial protein [Burkholderia diffusa]|uniref:fimbrial protein n=1 Tax=Burkholderia diffusa TaxID=488732 RepID=UPI0009BD15FA|nr:fimbrial protein [Burkholderia diffusa]
MNRAVLLLFLVIWSAYSTPAFSAVATVCYKTGAPTKGEVPPHQVYSGDPPEAIPAGNMPLGAVVWQSSEVVFDVTCERLIAAFREESLPVQAALVGNGFGVRGLVPGYEFQGVKYPFDRIMRPTPYILGPKVGDKVSFKFIFSIIIVRRAGDVPSGPMWGSSIFPTVQLNVTRTGNGAVVEGTAAAVYIAVNNPGITSIDCAADVKISKNTIDFNEVSAFRAVNNEIARQVPFEISSSRSCPGKFKVNATLKPLMSNSYTRGDFIMPLENDSIGIRIRNQGSGEIFPFNQKKELADLTSATSQTNRYVAEAVWQTDKPKLGRFEAGATLQIEYQ